MDTNAGVHVEDADGLYAICHCVAVPTSVHVAVAVAAEILLTVQVEGAGQVTAGPVSEKSSIVIYHGSKLA